MSDDNVIDFEQRRETLESDEYLKKNSNNYSINECCSFCGRLESEVLDMVKGPGVNICSECTMIAVQYLILKDKMPSKDAQNILDTFWSFSK